MTTLAADPRPARLLSRHGTAELPTLALMAGCYAGWAAVTLGADALGLWLATPLAALLVTLHSSLQHEALHGHPFRDPRLNHAAVFPALGLAVPYERFRDTHIAHHRDERLTDPYEDPESNFLDPAVWARLSRPHRALLRANNALAGRFLLGPAIGLLRFWADELRAIRRGDRAVARAWALHAAGAAPVLAWVAASPMPLWAYLVACYLGMSVLKIRTFLEHRAHERAEGRTVVIEDRGPLALLFLNNNYHAVHHAEPNLPWTRLPAAYAARREAVLARNGGYRYGSYAEVIAKHFLRAKDPVPHPLWPRS
jgi:fatty acid desaturase